MGVDPYHFWQMTNPVHPMQGYSQIYPHERWQHTVDVTMPARSAKRGPGRFDMLRAIVDAEEKLAGFHALNTWPGPRYADSEVVRLKKPRQPMLYQRTPYGLRTRWWHVQLVGVQTYTPIDTVAPVYDASDDVTVEVDVGSVSADEVVICYPGTHVQIRPISVSKVGDIATVSLKKWLCAKPELWETGDAIDSADNANLLDEVDVYRVWVDTTSQIVLAWEPEIYNCADGGEICSLASCTACAVRKDYSIGYVGWQTATYDEDAGKWKSGPLWPFSRFPDIASISYVHGFPTDGDRYMSPEWRRVVAYLAAAELSDYVWDVTSQPEILYDWRVDLAKQEEGNRFSLSMADLDNPFGTRRGQVYAWKALKSAIGD